MNTPTTVPSTVPMPPNRLVPPMTTAGMACRLSVECPGMVVVAKRASESSRQGRRSSPASA